MMTTEVTAGATFGTDGRYRLQRLIGAGGTASVWLARDGRLDRDVAVKVLSDVLALDAELVARFEREARLAAGLSHPHLVAVLDFCVHGPRPYLVMEHVPGGTLSDLIRGQAAPQLARGPVELACELFAALAYVHGAGIVHRDIKPANILVGADGGLRLTDFGIARPSDATRITGTGLVVGTQRYIAPEVLRGEPATERSDLYSCGVLLREWPGATAVPRLRRLIEALAAEDPADRPPSAVAAAAMLSGSDDVAADAAELPTEFLPPPTAGAATRLTATAASVPAPPEAAGASPEVPRGRRRLASAAASRLRPVVAGLAGIAAVAVSAILLTGGQDAAARPLAPGPAADAPLERQLDHLDALIDRAAS